MDFKIYRYIGKAVLPIVAGSIILTGSIHFEYPNEVPHWKKPTFYHTHEHIETRQYIPPKLNIIVSGTTTTLTTSTSTTF